jgi:hypothetical protein
MKLFAARFVLMAGVCAATGCGTGGDGTAATTTEETNMSAPPTITVAQATDENSRLVALIVGDEFERSAFQDVAQIGCRTDPESLMSVGPPFSVRTTWVKQDPTPEFVSAALRRVDSLQAEGFQRTAWTRPEPEPPNTRAYKDDRGYGITASDKVRPSGKAVFEIYVNSPCANP